MYSSLLILLNDESKFIIRNNYNLIFNRIHNFTSTKTNSLYILFFRSLSSETTNLKPVKEHAVTEK